MADAIDSTPHDAAVWKVRVYCDEFNTDHHGKVRYDTVRPRPTPPL